MPRGRCADVSVTGWAVCRFHGACDGGPKGARDGAYRHGFHTVEAMAEQRAVTTLLGGCGQGSAESTKMPS